MEDNAKVAVEETVEKKVERLEAENGKLKEAASHWYERAKELNRKLMDMDRLGLLMSIVEGKAGYPSEWMRLVKAEVMYRVNGYDPNGYFTKPEGAVPTGADEDIDKHEEEQA